MAARKSHLTAVKRQGMRQKVNEELKKQNPLKPAITKKSVALARKASGDGEFHRSRKLSQKAHSTILHKASQKKENKRESMRKRSQDIEVIECSFRPRINAEANKKIGFSDKVSSGTGQIQAESRMPTSREVNRKSKLYEQG